jgi:ribosomal protein S18
MLETNVGTNNYSNKLTLPLLNKGETVQYRLLGLKKDAKGRWLIPAAKNVPTEDHIFDPGVDKQGGYIDVAYEHGQIWFERRSLGMLIITGGNKRNQELYQYLEHCNYNASNTDRDASIKPIFERIDAVKKATKKRQTREYLRDAMNLAYELNDDEVRTLISSLGKDEDKDISILRDEIEEMAMSNPKAFISNSSNHQKQILATIKRAIDKKVIVFDSEQSRFVWGNNKEVILSTPRVNLKKRMKAFLEYVLNTKQGQIVYEGIEQQLKQ